MNNLIKLSLFLLQELKDDVDSDGFEIVGSKEEKKQKFRDEHRGDYIPRRGRGNWKRNKYWKRRDHENEKKEEKMKKIMKKKRNLLKRKKKKIKIKLVK